MIKQSDFLTQFSTELPIVVSCDSSMYGIGASLEHIKDWKEIPAWLASRSLNNVERNYSQLDERV